METYIQSGNVIFESEESKASILEEQIERHREKACGKRIQRFVRTTREVRLSHMCSVLEERMIDLVIESGCFHERIPPDREDYFR